LIDHANGLAGAHTSNFQFAYFTTHGFVLPYMEQDPLYNSMKVGPGRFGEHEVAFYLPTANLPRGGQSYSKQVKSYYSPADPSISNGQATTLVISKPNLQQNVNPNPLGPPSGATSYAANFKVFGALNLTESAVVSFDRAWTIAAIPDGSSNVIFMAEKYGTCTSTFIPGAPTNQGIPVVPAGSGGSLWAEPNLNENSPFFAYPQGGNNTYTAGVGLKFQVQPNPFNQKCNPFRASTPHAIGILVLMGDGSVRSIKPTISDQTWYLAVTPHDLQKLGDDW
jgi:hypothetical protein